MPPARSNIGRLRGRKVAGGGFIKSGISVQSEAGVDGTHPHPHHQKPTAAVAEAVGPMANGSVTHRNLRKGIVSASELSLDDYQGEQEDFLEMVSVIRFPPAVAAILRGRLVNCFKQTMEGWYEGTFKEVSSRGPLGLSITPTAREDYRLFDVLVDVMEEDELEVLKRWHPKFDRQSHPPQLLSLNKNTGGPARASVDATRLDANPAVKLKAKPKAKLPGSNRTSLVSETAAAVESAIKLETSGVGIPSDSNLPPPDPPIATLKLKGLLTDLPALIEIYKSFDLDSMVKSADVSQLMVVFFPEDESKFFPTKILDNSPLDIHHCCEKVQFQLDANEAIVDPSKALLEDLTKLRASKCPWLWPSGITPPMQLFRERRTRDLELYDKAEIQTCEIEILSLLKGGRQEFAQIELASALEGYLQQEALRSDASVPNADQVIRPFPESKVCAVVTEAPTNIFDDPASDFSDELFGDEPVQDERQIFDSASTATGARKRTTKRSAMQTAMIQYTPSEAGGGVHTSLQDEFQELAQIQVRQQLQEDSEADFEAEFNFGSMIMDSSNAESSLEESDKAANITSMRKIDRHLWKKTILKKKKKDGSGIGTTPKPQQPNDTT